MQKLLKLREWLTIEETAAHLSNVLSEPVSGADVLGLGVSGHLTLSVHFVNHAHGTLGTVVPPERAPISVLPTWGKLSGEEMRALPRPPKGMDRDAVLSWIAEHKELFDSEKLVAFQGGDAISGSEILVWDEAIVTLAGVWDIPRFGGAKLDAEHMLQQAIGGPEVTLLSLGGTVVVNPDGERYALVLEELPKKEGEKPRTYRDPKNYFPAGSLPKDASIVVRPEAIQALLASLEDSARSQTLATPPEPTELDPRQRTSALRVIRALAEMAHLPERGAAASVVRQLEILGFRGPGEATVRGMLKDARDLEPDKRNSA